MKKLVYPSVCPICGSVIGRQEHMCGECLEKYPVQPLRFPIISTDAHTVNCRALYLYRSEVREGLLAMKFSGQCSRAQGFGAGMGGQFEPGAFDVVTGVPMDRKRERIRGYNQARLLAKYCAEVMHLPEKPLLHKTRKTAIQHDLIGIRAREQNVAGAYASVPLHGERVLLCDDIATTGMTLRACAWALLDAGASEVQCICVAWANG